MFTQTKIVLLVVASAAGVAAAGTNFKVTKVSVGGDGEHDYIASEPGTGRVFVSRSSHVAVVDGRTGKVIGDIRDMPRMHTHGIAVAKKANHGFASGTVDSAVLMFDLKTLAILKRIPGPAGGLANMMYDDSSDRIVMTTHPNAGKHTPGSATFIDPRTGEIVATVELDDEAPNGAVGDGKGHVFVNNERNSTIQTIDLKTMKAVASWPIAPCKAPSGIAYDRKHRRIFAGCSNTSVVLDADSGKVVATIANGDGVDGVGWDPAEKLLYIAAGTSGNVTIVHQDSADKYTTVATVETMAGAKKMTVDPTAHKAYLVALEYGPAPAAADAPQGAPAARGVAPADGAPQAPARGPRQVVVGAQLVTISH
jgi:DNA-binding beta-propeller fold protein YncE